MVDRWKLIEKQSPAGSWNRPGFFCGESLPIGGSLTEVQQGPIEPDQRDVRVYLTLFFIERYPIVSESRSWIRAA